MIRGLALGLLAVFASFALAFLTPRPGVRVLSPTVEAAPLALSFGTPQRPVRVIPALDNLSPEARASAMLALEQVRAPCTPCWEQRRSIAACLQLGVCPNLSGLLQRTRRLAAAGHGAEDLVRATSYGDIWVPEAAGAATGPVRVELWIDPDDAFSAEAFAIAERIAALPSAPSVTVFAFERASTSGPRRGIPGAKVDFLQMRSALVTIVPARGSDTRDAAAARGVRSSPTWFVHGYRLRGMQSNDALALVLRREIDDRQGRQP